MLAETRELALRAQVHLEQELRGMRDLVSALTFWYGTHDGIDKMVLELDEQQMNAAKREALLVSFVPSGEKFAVVVALKTPEQLQEFDEAEDVPTIGFDVVKTPGATKAQVLQAAQANVADCVDALFDDEDEYDGDVRLTPDENAVTSVKARDDGASD